MKIQTLTKTLRNFAHHNFIDKIRKPDIYPANC